ncbi:MAG: ABC transporter permease [Planctomycetes bacterium]|nr:ABC transporter permease [Planctomycetota bacterium]
MTPALRRSYELLLALVAKEFKVRYKSTTLGFFWSLANPIFFALVFYVAFRHILKVSMENYFAFLLAGLFPWQWFANTVNISPAVFLNNAALIKKVAFPRLLLPAAMIGNHLVHFVLALLVAIPVVIAFGSRPTLWWIPGIPALLVVQFGVILGLSLMLSSLNVFFRDLEHLTMIFTNLLLYLSPVIYREDLVPEAYRPFFRLNPLYSIIPAWRHLILEGRLDGAGLLFGAAGAAFLLAVGYLVYRNLEWRFAESI